MYTLKVSTYTVKKNRLHSKCNGFEDLLNASNSSLVFSSETVFNH